MPYIKRSDEEIIAAIKHWLEQNLDSENQVFYTPNGCHFTPKEMIAAIERRDPMIKRLVKNLRELGKKYNRDPVKLFNTRAGGEN